MKIKSKATGSEMEISDEVWGQYKAQGFQSKFTVTKKSETLPEVSDAVAVQESTAVDTTPKPTSTKSKA